MCTLDVKKIHGYDASEGRKPRGGACCALWFNQEIEGEEAD